MEDRTPKIQLTFDEALTVQRAFENQKSKTGFEKRLVVAAHNRLWDAAKEIRDREFVRTCSHDPTEPTHGG